MENILIIVAAVVILTAIMGFLINSLLGSRYGKKLKAKEEELTA